MRRGRRKKRGKKKIRGKEGGEEENEPPSPCILDPPLGENIYS
jgi:hypothetical protein